jgi:hypothetical protein
LLLIPCALLAQAPQNPSTAPQQAPPQTTTGCQAAPVKKPKIRVPKFVQDAINKAAKKANDKAGVQVDPNAPQTTIDQTVNKPCPPPAPAKQ